jgi:hypothetical protein
MAKPIFIVRIPQANLPFNFDSQGLAKRIKKGLSNQYHVMVQVDPDITETKFECFNDVNGLPNIDIYKLIKELHETKSPEETRP